VVQLPRGANHPLLGDRIEVRVSTPFPVDVLALLVDRDERVRSDHDVVFWNAVASEGVRWVSGEPARLTMDLARLPEEVSAVLVVLALPGEARVPFGQLPVVEIVLEAVTGRGGASEPVHVPLTGLDQERAVVGAEIYRRAAAWKVRSVAQGHAEGLARLLLTHGVDVVADGDAEPHGPVVTDGDDVEEPPAPQLVDHADRAWLIWEDASRAVSAFRSSMGYALQVRDQELAGRTVRTGHQSIMRAAQERLDADLAQLTAEIAGSSDETPAAMASWNSAAWSPAGRAVWGPGAQAQRGVLAGYLGLPEAPRLRLPLVLRSPWSQAQWISYGSLPGDSVAFGWSLVTRYLAALPAGAVAVEVVDPGGLAGLGWLDALPRPVVDGVLAGGVAAGRQRAATRLGRLLDVIDLRAIGAGKDIEAQLGGRPLRLVVVIDPTAAASDEGLFNRLVRIVEDGPGLGVPTICVETDAEIGDSLQGMRLRQAGQSLPSGAGSSLGDPWVRSEWVFSPDLLPDASAVLRGPEARAPELLRHVLSVQQSSLFT
jgi:stress response protein SCP2